MVSLGLPPLHSSLSEHFAALSASFAPKPTGSSPTLPTRVVQGQSSGLKIPAPQPPAQKQQPSPISSASGFMAEHENFHSFLMTMLPTFPKDIKHRPEFPVAQVDDPLFVRALYCINAKRLRRLDGRVYHQVHAFTPEEVIPFPTLTDEFVYFKLV